MSGWHISVTPMPTEEALSVAARVAEEPDCEDLLLTEGARALDRLACEVLGQADVVERLTAELSTATGEIARLRAELAASCDLARTVEAQADEIERLKRENATLRAAYAQDLDGLRAELRRADDERAWWRGHDRAAEMLTAQRDAAVARADTAERERDAARAALRDASRCEACGAWATRYHTASASYGCDSCGVGDGWADDTHAPALRAALERTP